MSEAEELQVFRAQTLDDLPQIAASVIALGPGIILLTGELGAGKTALVKSLCASLGSQDEVSSPTFSLVNEYRDDSDTPIYHIDLYRLNTVEEAVQIGIEEYLYSGGWCFIEWPELIFPLISDLRATKINIDIQQDGSRRIRILK